MIRRLYHAHSIVLDGWLLFCVMDKTVLLVDDDKTFKLLLEKAFKEQFYNTVTVGNTTEALDKLHEFAPDIMLLDLGLPGESGMEFLRKLRSGNEYPDLLVIMLTNNTSFEEIANGYELGIRRYIIKSETTTEQIIQAVTETLTAEENSKK